VFFGLLKPFKETRFPVFFPLLQLPLKPSRPAGAGKEAISLGLNSLASLLQLPLTSL